VAALGVREDAALADTIEVMTADLRHVMLSFDKTSDLL
jgi:hypothetical protein